MTAKHSEAAAMSERTIFFTIPSSLFGPQGRSLFLADDERDFLRDPRKKPRVPEGKVHIPLSAAGADEEVAAFRRHPGGGLPQAPRGWAEPRAAEIVEDLRSAFSGRLSAKRLKARIRFLPNADR